MNNILRLQALQTDTHDRNDNLLLLSAISVVCPADGPPVG